MAAARNPDIVPVAPAGTLTAARRPHAEVGRWLVTLAGIAIFFAVWAAAASVMPESRLVSPVKAAEDLFANFVFSPRLDVFGLGDAGYGLLTLYTLENVLIGLST